MASVTILEYGLLTTEPGHDGLDRRSIPESAFEHICQLSLRWSRSGFPLLALPEGQRALRVDNYVGVLETPCGLQLEILPKHVETDAGGLEARRLLLRMLAALLDIKPRQGEVADIALLRRPMTEWVARQFLEHMGHLVQRGMKFDYREEVEELGYVRGRINMPAQLRHAGYRAHRLQVVHDVFLADGPENRLLRSALRRIATVTRDATNWRLARELALRTEEIPDSAHVVRDFQAWRGGRLMAHYAAIRPWCALVLGEQMPMAQAGPQRGMSMLFPMQDLFERYVTLRLREMLKPGLSVTSQSTRHSLCRHEDKPMFQLRPDILVHGQGRLWLMDAKWKLLNGADRDGKYGITQADMYQLFAYGHHYLGGSGDMYLVYPRTSAFDRPLPPFHFSNDMRVRAIPFDCNLDNFVCEDLEFLSD